MRPSEAGDALTEIARAQDLSGRLKGYATAGSTLIAWGLVWLIANLASQFAPVAAGPAWLIGSLAALLWSATRPPAPGSARILAAWLVCAGYLALVMAVVRTDHRTAAMLIALFVGAAYVVAGLWAGPRFIGLGAVLIAVALLAWLFAPAWLFLALALGGGGTLIAGGAWLSRA